MDSCLNCNKRHPGCHDTCDNHIKENNKRTEVNKRRREATSSVGWEGYLKVKEIIRR